MKGGTIQTRITEEQLRLARLIADGLTKEQIADKLGLAPRRVKTQCDELRWIFGVKTTRQLPALMRKLGLL